MRGFCRISAAVPICRVTDFSHNREHTLRLWRQAHRMESSLVIFPELGLCSYTSRDLLCDTHLIEACLASLGTLLADSRDLRPLAVVGLPLRVGPSLYNVAAALQGGRILALVPKTYLPSSREFEEARWFRPGTDLPPGSQITILGQTVPLGSDLLLEAADQPDLVLGLEICEDLWAPVPPSAFQALAGATVIGNLSASNFTIGKAELRRLLARSSSDRGKCAYIYVAAGPGESSTDMAFDADAFICENGQVMASSRRFLRQDQLVTLDLDLELLAHERLLTSSFGACAGLERRAFRRIPFQGGPPPSDGLRFREVAAHPFLPRDPATLAARCFETFEIQQNALLTRMQATGIERLVLGLSGGLDSTHAALVCAGALDLWEKPRKNLLCLTMPGLGTSPGTLRNAHALAGALGATLVEVSIAEGARLVLSALGHPAASETRTVPDLIARLRERPELGDITLENVQARLRTLFLMTHANAHRGLVVGTGDLSEKALGWSTYAGDHIAMYDVNAGIPKTLIQFVIRWVAMERARSWTSGDVDALRQTLEGILDTPISPELLPADAAGRIAQLTEASIGPYELHDFFLYHLVRHGARPSRILDLAQAAFRERYTLEDLKSWLSIFLSRFFRNQFKRSCATDGPKVGMVALSPRGDWRMPSDAEPASWLEEVRAYTGS